MNITMKSRQQGKSHSAKMLFDWKRHGSPVSRGLAQIILASVSSKTDVLLSLEMRGPEHCIVDKERILVSYGRSVLEGSSGRWAPNY